MVARWVRWAGDTVDAWPDDVTEARFDVAAAEEGVRLAESIPAILDGDPAPSTEGAAVGSIAAPDDRS
jgi:hypothetical protein